MNINIKTLANHVGQLGVLLIAAGVVNGILQGGNLLSTLTIVGFGLIAILFPSVEEKS